MVPRSQGRIPQKKYPTPIIPLMFKREEEAERGTFEEKGESGHQAKKSKEVVGEGEQKTPMEVEKEDEVEEMELGELDLDAIEAECRKT